MNKKEDNKKNKYLSNKRKKLVFVVTNILACAVVLGVALIVNTSLWFYAFSALVIFFSLRYRVKWMENKRKKRMCRAITCVVIFIALYVSRANITVSFSGNFFNNAIKFVNRTYYENHGENIITEELEKQATPYEFGSWIVPIGYSNTEVTLSNSRAYMLKKKKESKEIIYQIHGGGYVKVFSDKYNIAAINYSKTYNDADVFSIDYRTAPNNKYPCALEDTVDGYLWLLDNGYKANDIVVCGDSAGGGLAIAMAMYIRDNKLAELPKALVLASPWTNLTISGYSYNSKKSEDAIFGVDNSVVNPKRLIPTAYAQGFDATNPYISPVYGDFTGLPPMLIQTGSAEMLLSDSVDVVKKAKDQSVDVVFVEYKDMYHTFYLITPWVPESIEAWEKIEKFIQNN